MKWANFKQTLTTSTWEITHTHKIYLNLWIKQLASWSCLNLTNTGCSHTSAATPHSIQPLTQIYKLLKISIYCLSFFFFYIKILKYFLYLLVWHDRTRVLKDENQINVMSINWGESFNLLPEDFHPHSIWVVQRNLYLKALVHELCTPSLYLQDVELWNIMHKMFSIWSKETSRNDELFWGRKNFEPILSPDRERWTSVKSKICFYIVVFFFLSIV